MDFGLVCEPLGPCHTVRMADSIEGQTIRVTSKDPDGGEPIVSYYAVAEPDPIKASAIVKDTMEATADDLIEAIGSIPAEEIAALGLSPGEFERL